MSDATIFAIRLRQARLLAGYTQMQLGVAAQIDEYSASARINQYERGKHWPDFGTARRLASSLKVPVAFFYAVDDGLAELIQRFGALGAHEREALLDEAKALCKGDAARGEAQK
ncbi:MAG: helix-turn-helix domain-containing protein [Azoarcus sp.]|jgi:transcriptional regulator with XRE-family HTH domain|nr:helix-turn-helix domain-containing protein [Azoarcus sp.]